MFKFFIKVIESRDKWLKNNNIPNIALPLKTK